MPKTGRPKIEVSKSHIKYKNQTKLKNAPAPKNRLGDVKIWQSMIDSNPLIVVTWKQVGCFGCKPFETRVMSKTDKKFKQIPRIDIELVHDKNDPMEKLADRYKVDTTPAALVFKNGSEIGRCDSVGEFDRDYELITKILEREA